MFYQEVGWNGHLQLFKCIEQVRADITITIPDPIIQIPIKCLSIHAIIPIPAELSNLTRIPPTVNELYTN
jgi:hypothetical protein